MCILNGSRDLNKCSKKTPVKIFQFFIFIARKGHIVSIRWNYFSWCVILAIISIIIIQMNIHWLLKWLLLNFGGKNDWQQNGTNCQWTANSIWNCYNWLVMLIKSAQVWWLSNRTSTFYLPQVLFDACTSILLQLVRTSFVYLLFVNGMHTKESDEFTAIDGWKNYQRIQQLISMYIV